MSEGNEGLINQARMLLRTAEALTDLLASLGLCGVALGGGLARMVVGAQGPEVGGGVVVTRRDVVNVRCGLSADPTRVRPLAPVLVAL